MSNDTLLEISRKLDLIINLLIKNNIKNLNTIESTKYLNEIGFTNLEIGKYFNIKPNIVSARLSKKKKNHKKII